ncbi:hypothetical protein A0J61_01768 [Choanephora cucurbitarum]|uniref:DUF7905 domain-containing protein n=1 Tax=Choanephora cucurbitarum TaxID=101091 RepID=A0A1C7NMJ4_9FUNG|nr:hypothetical protein A0J61_01768 [Choanephora cucurbitarum]
MQAEGIIRQQLLPLLNQQISHDYINGTFSSETPASIVQRGNSTNGRPLDFEIEEGEEENFSYQPVLEQQDVEDTNDLVVATFRILPIIQNVSNLLIGPPQQNMQPIDYIKAIESSTGVKCCLENRIIKITGELESVKEAECRFRVIQKTYISRIKPKVVTCLHYPEESGQYGLYFCNLDLYRHKKFVHIQLRPDEPSRFCILIPTFINPHTNEYDPPTDLVYSDIPQPLHAILAPSVSSNHTRLSTIENSHNTIPPLQSTLPKRAPVMTTPPSMYTPTSPPTPTSTVSGDRFHPPNWGGDRTFTSSFNTGNLDYLSSERLARAFTPPHSHTSDTPSLMQDFPSLKSTSSIDSDLSCSASVKHRPSVSLDKPKPRRVMRIVPQKSSSVMNQQTESMLHRVKRYNYYMIKNALEEGLEAVRGFRGEIRLSAKLGKVMWSNINGDISHKVWNLQDINDIVVKELGAKPSTTLDENIINCMSSERLLQTRPFRKTSFYEFHCQARNQPTLPYRKVVLHMNQGVLDIDKVVITESKVTEVNWISLDRKYDFQLNLTTKELIRKDVKPFTTFIKWISICPITRVMTYEDVNNFLEVEYILLKSTTRYRTGPLFIVEITRYEKVRTKQVKGSSKKTSLPGQGEVWYDFEVINALCDAPFKDNLDLDPGCKVKWKTEDILQTESTESTITAFVKFLLQLIEGIERVIR